jgi:hypothetical protein
MPSETCVMRALEVVLAPAAQYRSAVVATLDDVRGHLDAGRSDANARAEWLQRQLGPFAAGRIDAARLTGLVNRRELLTPATVRRLERASDALCSVLAAGDQLFHAHVSPGGDLRRAVAEQLGHIGRAFAAARIASAARTGAACALDEEIALATFPFSEWSAAERKLAPPLVVTVTGADLNAGVLAPFLDGAQKIFLVVSGPCAPAPLVRLVTPSIFVQQVHSVDELSALATWPGTAAAALVPESAVRFTHDPSAGPELWQRLSVHPARDARLSRIGGFSIAQQLDELRQLESLAARPAPPPSASTVAAPSVSMTATADSADRLAAWLLQQANLAAVASE